MLGRVEQVDGGYVVRFIRHLNHSLEKVWAAITSPDMVAQWLTAETEIELAAGGKVGFRFGNTGDVASGAITQVNPPTLIEYTWNSPDAGQSVVRWDLSAEGEGCLLILSHTFLGAYDLPRMQAGWHVHLEMLDGALADNPIAFPWNRWEEYHDKYRSMQAEAPSSSPAARIVRQLEAAPEHVFQAWIDPEQVKQWMFPQDEIVQTAIDARVGGSFSFVVRRDDALIEHIGTYLEIDPLRRLVFTWATVDDLPDADEVTVEIVPSGTGSALTLTHRMHPNWSEYAPHAEKAWNSMLDAMAGTLE
ncbi:SRPBCC domain-containing protein [Brevibacillus sp. TJ4]|uniref:SRPBCC domain-containing protein n=1 Tax=Brevibacillus sp. TJ4 TaxID=3234853 RepID=UPI0037D5034C